MREVTEIEFRETVVLRWLKRGGKFADAYRQLPDGVTGDDVLSWARSMYMIEWSPTSQGWILRSGWRSRVRSDPDRSSD